MCLVNIKKPRYKTPQVFYKLFHESPDCTLYNWNDVSTVMSEPYIWDEAKVFTRQFPEQTGFCAFVKRKDAEVWCEKCFHTHANTKGKTVITRIRVLPEHIVAKGVQLMKFDYFEPLHHQTVMVTQFEIIGD